MVPGADSWCSAPLGHLRRAAGLPAQPFHHPPAELIHPTTQENTINTESRAGDLRNETIREAAKTSGRGSEASTRTSDGPSAFTSFSLSDSVRRGIAAAGFREPRPIQAATVPAALAGRDVLGLAQTGTGKTAAFALPILERLLAGERRRPRALVLAPTRELAMQIHAEVTALAALTPLRSVTIFGGVPARAQISALRARADVLIACPGRLLDLMEQGFVDLGGIEILVLDEADHMFDIGFLPAIRRILAKLPAKRQNLLFSATMPEELRKLADRVLDRPHVVELAHSRPAATIDHALYPVSPGRKADLLRHVLADDDFSSGIVFTRTKHRAKRLAQQLGRWGHEAVALQGNMSQAQRDRAMGGFRAGRFQILVATDIAARGIDVAGVSHVINFDAPGTPDAYTHRIGRTGRAERAGKALTFVSGEDGAIVRAIERKLGASIVRREISGFDAGDPSSIVPRRGPRGAKGMAVADRSKPAAVAGRPRRDRSRQGRWRRRRGAGTAGGGDQPTLGGGGGDRSPRRRRAGNGA